MCLNRFSGGLMPALLRVGSARSSRSQPGGPEVPALACPVANFTAITCERPLRPFFIPRKIGDDRPPDRSGAGQQACRASPAVFHMIGTE